MWRWLMHFWPLWRVRHGFAPFPIPFAPSPNDVREWRVEINPPGTVLNSPLPANGVLRVSLHRILVETGIALTLATSAWDPRSWFALLRYGADFAGTAPRLRFYSGVQDKDPRLTAVASEEVATGITCYLLREHFVVTHIADAFACIQRGELAYLSPLSESRPDYLCEDAAGEALVAESKGATGTRARINQRIQPEGWSQVQNVAPVNPPLRGACNRVVIGTHICIEGVHPRTETTTVIRDPVGKEGRGDNPDSDGVIRLSYAKALRFMGHDVAADYLITLRDLRTILPFATTERLPTVGGLPFLPMDVTPFGDAIGFYGPLGKALLSADGTSLRPGIASSLRDIQDRRARGAGLLPDTLGYLLPNGVMVVHNPDEVL